MRREGLETDACLSVAQHALAMQELRSLFFKDDAVNTIYENHVKQFGADQAQRRRRSYFRGAMRRCFGHPVVADVLMIKGYWTKELQDSLTMERGRLQDAGGPTPENPPPSNHRTSTGRRKNYGAAKAKKRMRYYSNKVAALHEKEWSLIESCSVQWHAGYQLAVHNKRRPPPSVVNHQITRLVFNSRTHQVKQQTNQQQHPHLSLLGDAGGASRLGRDQCRPVNQW